MSIAITRSNILNCLIEIIICIQNILNIINIILTFINHFTTSYYKIQKEKSTVRRQIKHNDYINCPPRKIITQLGLWFGSRLGLVLGLGVDQTIAPEENDPPGQGQGLGQGQFWGWGEQFSSGAIVLEPILSAQVANVLINIKLIYCYKIQAFKYIIVDSETSRKPVISLMHNARESSDTL